jgi:hypothetical protein
LLNTKNENELKIYIAQIEDSINKKRPISIPTIPIPK